MKKKLPVLSKPTPAASQRELAVKPVTAGGKPEFPTRKAMYTKAGLIGGATMLAGGVASAGDAKAPPPPPPQQQQAAKPAPNDKAVMPSPETTAGTVDGQALAKTAPKFKVYRDGGGIGPAEDMWDVAEVEAFINWTMAKEGKLNIKTNYKFEYEGVSFDIDGFDPEKNVGYEYVDKLDYDKDYFTKEVKAKFDKWMKEKKAAILYLEIKKNPDTATIKGKVLKFLAAVKKKTPAAGKLAAK
ncbi:MAG: hypothetical protein H0T46_34695 [Deltaproteobacteria bacterium]|nr:hypothetical protein [Deltaproteobacteria bacterium]